MAINTETRRRSVAGYVNAVMYPVPGTADSAFRREHIAWLYAGIAASGPVVVTGLVQMVYALQRIGD